MTYDGKQAVATITFNAAVPTDASIAGDLLNVQRGVDGTTPAPHQAGTMVQLLRVECAGDCNDDASVTVDELLTMVNIALGSATASTCEAGDENHDGQITIDEILTAVNNALNECQ
jgi:hypothetical protein